MAGKNEAGGVRDDYQYRPPSQEPQITLEELLQRLRAAMPRIPGIGGGGAGVLLLAILLVSLFIWLATGFYTVGPDQLGAIRTFGRFTDIAEPGLHWYWPAPIGTRNVVAVTTTRRLELGFRSGEAGVTVSTSVPTESLMITGDENIVDVQAVVQYRISDLPAFLFNVDDPGEVDRAIPAGRPDGRTLRDITETAVRQVVGARDIDQVLTTERELVQAEILQKMRELSSLYQTGIEVIAVLLQSVNPPAEVQPAFEDVIRAREERDRKINQAQAYEAARIPQATGEAAQIVEAAEAFRQGRIARAQGEAIGFNAILDGYLTSPDVTRRRLYLEAMEEILPGIKKFVLSDQGVLPLLPLEPAATTGGTQ